MFPSTRPLLLLPLDTLGLPVATLDTVPLDVLLPVATPLLTIVPLVATLPPPLPLGTIALGDPHLTTLETIAVATRLIATVRLLGRLIVATGERRRRLTVATMESRRRPIVATPGRQVQLERRLVARCRPPVATLSLHL